MERTLMDVGEPHFTRTKRVDGTARLERVLDAKTRTIGVLRITPSNARNKDDMYSPVRLFFKEYGLRALTRRDARFGRTATNVGS
eukprot:1183181-Prorocentrum_minimum.AAC.3